MVPFSFAEEEWRFTDSGALFWPREQALLIADLHLEKASFFACHGQMLPPYDSRETLERVAAALRETGARRVFTLGDNFHDSDGARRLEPYAEGMLHALTRAVDWIWISGNHDEQVEPLSGGTPISELEIGGFILRHRARPDETRAELSGHFHPRIKVVARGRRIVRPCAVVSSGQPGTAHRLILPAFGSLTGGMDAAAPEIVAAMQPAGAIDAVFPAGGQLTRFPLWRQTV